jgi:hypothetical protein
MKSVNKIAIPKNINDKINKKERFSSDGQANYTADVVAISKF